MILDHRQYKNIEFKKYKRVFMFGCSFTNYTWPTWANILHYMMPDVEGYNFGQSGGGNLFIAERIIAANQLYRFTDKDLILVMWSTFSREDRYIENRWETPGNIWTQGFYDSNFIKKYACVKGYIVRDLALITMTKHSLSYLPCDTIMLKSVDPEYDKRYYDGDESYEDVIDLYRDVIYDMPASLYTHMTDGKGGWINGHHYHWPSIPYSSPKTPFQDYHPNPSMYLRYLKDLGFDITDAVVDKVDTLNKELQKHKDRESIEKWYNDILNKQPKYHHSKHLI